MTDSISSGLSGIKDIFTDEDKRATRNKIIAGIAGGAATLGGIIAFKKFRKKPPIKWGDDETESMFEEIKKRLREKQRRK